MTTYVILSRFSPEAFREPHEFKKLAEAVSAKIKSECSGIRWKDSYATLGRFDVVDVVEANDPKQIEKAAMKTCTDMLGGGLSPFARRQN